jgi:CheY-like chemotaxis protein
MTSPQPSEIRAPGVNALPSALHPPDKPRVLIVDDNADAANSLGRLLRLMGNDVCVVHDGPAAIVKVTEFFPAVVLLDLGMPGMDGLETAELIRRQPAGRDVALIAVTGWGQDSDRQRTAAAGFVAHLTKPVNIDQLEMAIAAIVVAGRSA